MFRKTKNLDQLPLPGANQYIVTLWDLPTWKEVDIVIDERLAAAPDGSLLASKPSEDGELWVCYLEKAISIHCGGWDNITGGQSTHAWAMMTGCRNQYTIKKNNKSGLYACHARLVCCPRIRMVVLLIVVRHLSLRSLCCITPDLIQLPINGPPITITPNRATRERGHANGLKLAEVAAVKKNAHKTNSL